jgi:predicted XRE-type DNA-binding protein
MFLSKILACSEVETRGTHRDEAAVTEAADERVKVTRSSGSVFEDLGFANLDEELGKAKLVSALAEVIRERNLAQTNVAELLGVDQPTVSKLLRGRTGGFTSDRPMRLLNLLDQDVEITVRPKRLAEASVSVSVAHTL